MYKMNESVVELPSPFRERIERFKRIVPGWDAEPYEAFICGEAAKIAAELKTEERVISFGKAGPSEKKKLVPSLDYERHSGNTMYTAVSLAHCAVVNPEWVPKMHAALCPIQGCQGAGCWAAYEGASGEEP